MTSVTLKDVYEIADRIEQKLDKVECRVSTLELWKAEIMGKIAVVGFIVIFVGNFIVEWIKERIKV